MSIKKIDYLTYNNSGLIVAHKQKEVSSILYSDIVKIYIEKQKLELKIKSGILSVLLLLVFTSIVFLPIEMALIFLFLSLPLLVWIYDFKSYRLNIIDQSNTLYFKKFYKSNKQEHIELVNFIRKEIFDNKIKSRIRFEEDL